MTESVNAASWREIAFKATARAEATEAALATALEDGRKAGLEAAAEMAPEYNRWPGPSLATALEDGRKAGLEAAAELLRKQGHEWDRKAKAAPTSQYGQYCESMSEDCYIHAEQVRALAASPVPGDGWKPIVERLRWTTETLQSFLDTFGDLGDRVTQADIDDTWDMLRATPAPPSPPDREGTVVPGEG